VFGVWFERSLSSLFPGLLFFEVFIFRISVLSSAPGLSKRRAKIQCGRFKFDKYLLLFYFIFFCRIFQCRLMLSYPGCKQFLSRICRFLSPRPGGPGSSTVTHR
jgi:hypothetical protein